MIDTIKSWLHEADIFFTLYPSISAILLAMLLSWPPGMIWDNWFAPESWAPRKVKQVSLGITVAIAAIASGVCWHKFVPTDSMALVVLISIISAFSAPIVHLLIGGVLDKYVPWIDLDAKLKPPTK